MMRRRPFLLAVAGTLAAPAVLRAQAPIELRYNTWAKEGEAQHVAALRFKEVVEAETQGRMRVTVFGGNQLGEPREVLAQLALNTTQVLASGDPGSKEIEYLALPYLMRALPNLQQVLALTEAQKWVEDMIKRRRVRPLGFLPRNPRQISANKIINTLDDLKGLKLRSPENDYYVASLAALGSRPTPMAFTEVYQALQLGTVDGQENPIETIWASKFFEVQKCVAMVDYIDKPAYIVISEPFWQKLSPADRAAVEKAQLDSAVSCARVMPGQAKEILDKFKAAGVAVTYPDKAPFIAATQKVRDELGRKTWGDALYARIAEIGQRQV